MGASHGERYSNLGNPSHQNGVSTTAREVGKSSPLDSDIQTPSDLGYDLNRNLSTSKPDLLQTSFPAKWNSNWDAEAYMTHSKDILYSKQMLQPSIESPPNHILQNVQLQRSIPSGVDTHNFDIPSSTQAPHQVSPDFSSNADPVLSIPHASEHDLTNRFAKQRRPCDQCRRKKTKCVIIPGTTNCVQCESKGLTCTYMLSATKRKAADPDSTSKKRRSKQDELEDAARAGGISAFQEIVPPNVPIRETLPVEDYSTINDSLLNKTLSLQFPRLSFYVGPSSYLYDSDLMTIIIDDQKNHKMTTPTEPAGQSAAIQQVSLTPTVSLRKVSEDEHFILCEDLSIRTFDSMSGDVDAIEKFVAPHGPALIDLYFRIIHPSYPILHKKVFLEKYSRTHREFSAPLLAAVYVLAIQWWSYDPHLYQFAQPNTKQILRLGLKHFLVEIVKRPKLSGVQAGLLLLQCKRLVSCDRNPGFRPNDDSEASLTGAEYSDWVLYSQVGSLAEELGLGSDCSSWKLPSWERGLRTRLAWAVFLEDKWFALRYGRPSHINPNDWMVTPLMDEDFPEKHGDGDFMEGSVHIDYGKRVFILFVALSQIVSDILSDLYSLKAMMSVTQTEHVLQIAKPLQLRLRDWFHSIPEELRMTSIQPRKLCANGYLQLAYFAAELSLHRRITSVMYKQTLGGDPPAPHLVNVCRTAARARLVSAIDFVRDLKPEHVHAFWHSSASLNLTLIGTFAALLFVSSSTAEEASFYRDQTFNYRWILKVSAKGFAQMEAALEDLDSVWRHIPGLVDDGPGLPLLGDRVQMPYITQKVDLVLLSQACSPKSRLASLRRGASKSSIDLMNQQSRPGHKRGPESVQSPSTNNMPLPEGHQVMQTRAHLRTDKNESFLAPGMSFVDASPAGVIQHPISRGSGVFVDSPQSSQAFSPTEIMKMATGADLSATENS